CYRPFASAFVERTIPLLLEAPPFPPYRNDPIHKKFTLFSLTALCLATVTNAAPTPLIFWDFLGGGDGVRMTQIVDEFNKSQKDIQVTKSTLTWGEPFYTKVH